MLDCMLVFLCQVEQGPPSRHLQVHPWRQGDRRWRGGRPGRGCVHGRVGTRRECRRPLGRRNPGHSTKVRSQTGRLRGGLIFGTAKTSEFSSNAQSRSRLFSIVLDSVLGPLRPARHTWQCPCFSLFRKQRTRRVKGLWRALCQLKKPFKGRKQRQGICWEERKSEKVLS